MSTQKGSTKITSVLHSKFLVTILWKKHNNMLSLSQSLYVPFCLCVSVFARVFLCTLLLVCHGVCMTCPLSLVCLSVCTLDCLSQGLNVPFCLLTYVFVCTLFLCLMVFICTLWLLCLSAYMYFMLDSLYVCVCSFPCLP